jgi:energy-coupling factor transport system substrate-specific component
LRTGSLIVANLIGMAAFFWPFFLPAAVGDQAAGGIDAFWIFVGLAACLGTLLFVELGRGGIGPKAVALVGVLGAAMVALRLPGYVGGFSFMFIIVLLGGNAFGASFGFVLGAIGLFASGLFVGGIGPWLPFQMVATGWIGLGAGLLPKRGDWRIRIGCLAVYGFVVGFVFGAIMNLWFWPFATGSSALGWAPELGGLENLRRYLTFYGATSAVWDLLRAVGNAALVILLGRPVLGALDRAAKKMRIDLRPARSDLSAPTTLTST